MEIDQAERDRTREANKKALQDNIQAIGAGIATGAIVTSSSGLIMEPITFPWQPQHGKYPHPFFIAVIVSGCGSFLFFLLAKWWIEIRKLK